MMDPITLSSPRPASITGCLCPFRADDPSQPHLFMLPDSADQWVLVFSDMAMLKERMAQIGESRYRVKLIQSGYDFTLSIHKGGCRVALNPVFDIQKRTTRWIEIVAEPRGQA